MGTHTAPLIDLAEEVLSTGAVVLTGGVDMTQTPILTFPEAAHERLACWSVERLLGALRHYLQWVKCMRNIGKLALLANLQQASKAAICVIVEAAEKLELQSRGTITALYCLKPRVKARSAQLKKLLGLKPSKKHPKIPLFKVLLLKTHQDLFNQIDMSELTPEFGGTLDYNHAAWVRFHQTVGPCVREAENIIRRLPDVRDRVELLQEYEVNGQSAADIQTLLTELSDKYHLTISEARFQETLDRCKQTLLLLDRAANSHADWLSQVHADHVTQAASCVRQLFQELDAQRFQLDEIWRGIEDNLTVYLQIQKHRERAVEIEKKIKTHFEPLLKEHPCVASTLSQAELYRTHFTTSLYEPAKELLAQATEILEDIQRLKARALRPSCDVSDITQQLTVTLQPFTQHLQGLQDVHVAVHIFHLLLEKALRWYRKVLKFLPDALQDRLRELPSDQILQMPLEWQQSVHSFLHRHPPPQEQHIAKLDTDVPQQVDRRLRLQARSLALRLRLLQRLLFSRRLPAKLLEAAFLWKSELNSSTAGSSSTKEVKAPTREDGTENAIMAQLISQPRPSVLPLKRSGSFSSTDTGDMGFFVGRGDSPVTFRSYDSSAEDERKTKAAANVVTKEDAGELPSAHQMDIKVVSPASKLGDNAGENVRKVPDLVTSRQAPRVQAKALERVQEQERFVRLTYSPSGTQEKRRRAFNHEDSLESEDFRWNAAGSESGIEVLEAEDPCDTIVDKIKAVSSSSLPSDVKLQCVSHLLSSTSFRQRERRAETLRDFAALSRDRDVETSFRLQGLGRPGLRGGRLHSYRVVQSHERPRWTRRGRGDLSPQSDHGTRVQSYRFRNEAVTVGRPQAPPRFVFSDRPANAVARLRQRLARSLVELNIADDSNVLVGQQRSPTASKLRAKRFSYDPAMASDFQSWPSFRQKSEENILDTTRPCQDWKYHVSDKATRGSSDDAVESISWLEDRIPRSGNKYFGSHGDLLEFFNSSRSKSSPVRHSAQKSPSRWRQNIVVDVPDQHSRGHQQARDFIAPSFLQPSTSLSNIPFSNDIRAGFGPSDIDKLQSTAPRFRGQDTGQRKISRSEVFNEQPYSDSVDPFLIRLSDEADMEYLSQDELESSLKRSHMILKDAEERLATRNLHTSDEETESNQNLETTSVNPEDLKSSHSSETESNTESSSPEQSLTSLDPNADDENITSLWKRLTFDLPESGGLTTEMDWDADVSNISDHWAEDRNKDVL